MTKTPGRILHTKTPQTPVKPSVKTTQVSPETPTQNTNELEWITCFMYLGDTCKCCVCDRDIPVIDDYGVDINYLTKAEDEEGYYWRAFCPICYEKHKHDKDLDTLYQTHRSCCIPDTN